MLAILGRLGLARSTVRASKMKVFVYIVKCVDNSLYTGISKNLKNRLWQHNNSKLVAKSLRGKLPVVLVYSETHKTMGEALKRESEIKSWRREKKLKLINSLH